MSLAGDSGGAKIRLWQIIVDPALGLRSLSTPHPLSIPLCLHTWCYLARNMDDGWQGLIYEAR